MAAFRAPFPGADRAAVRRFPGYPVAGVVERYRALLGVRGRFWWLGCIAGQRLGLRGRLRRRFGRFAMEVPETRYATTIDGLSIAYQRFGDGDVDMVYLPGTCHTLNLPGISMGPGT